MGKQYLQLTYQDRKLISYFKSRGLNLTQIAQRVGVHKSTISRELKRNGRILSKEDQIFYHQLSLIGFPEEKTKLHLEKLKSECFDQHHWIAADAQRVYEHRLWCANQLRRRKQAQTKKWVLEKIKQHWSPQQIAGRSALDSPEKVSHEYVYQILIHDKKNGGRLYRHLKRFGKRKQRLAERIYPSQLLIPNRKSIEERPAIASNRSRLGDCEGDLIVGAEGSGYILSVIDRKSRYLVLRKLKTKRKRTVRIQLEHAIQKMKHTKTLTVDNGSEFYDHEALTKITDVPVYFTHPYCSTDKGSIENANALIRYYLPKRTSFKNLTQKKLNKIQDQLNHRPRKILNYLTPHEAHLTSRSTRSLKSSTVALVT